MFVVSGTPLYPFPPEIILKIRLKMERKHGKTLIKVRKRAKTAELKLDGWQIGFILPYPTVKEARSWLKSCEFRA